MSLEASTVSVLRYATLRLRPDFKGFVVISPLQKLFPRLVFATATRHLQASCDEEADCQDTRALTAVS